MKRRIIGALLLAGMISGCMSTSDGPEPGGIRPNYGQSFGPPMLPGVKGPYGEGVPMAAPYNQMRGLSDAAKLDMMSQNQPTSIMQRGPGGVLMPNGFQMPQPIPGAVGPNGMPMIPGGGMPPMPGGGMPPMMPPSGSNPFRPASMNSMIPGGGVVNANIPPGGRNTGGVTQAQFANNSPIGPMFPAQRTQVFFPKPAGMKVHWFTQGPDGKPSYSATPLETPGRYNFAQGAIYRLKLTHVPGRPALELYPTLEVVPTSPKTNEFLAHNSVPLEFSEEDFKQVVDRNYIVKVIYLPDPQFQDAAGAGPDEIVSTRLEAGQDPIQEALRRGSILLVLRIGNIDQGLQHSPPMTGAIPGGPPMMMKPPGQGVPPLFQVPFPTPAITPGVLAPNPLAPNPLPVMPEVKNPPDLKPELVLPPKKDEVKPIEPNKKDDVKPIDPPKQEEVRPVVPPFNPPPPNVNPPAPQVPPILLPNDVKPFEPPIPLPVEKRTNEETPPPGVPAIPTSRETIPMIPPPAAAPAPLLPMAGPTSTTAPAPPTPTLPQNELPIPLPQLPTNDPR